jgi:hypothetical protein
MFYFVFKFADECSLFWQVQLSDFLCILLDMEYVGETRHNVRMLRRDLTRCEAMAKTPAKLALSLLEFLLSSYEIKNCTMKGNPQFKKKAVPLHKRNAIMGKLFLAFK